MLIGATIALTVFGLYLMNRTWEQMARRHQRPHAPSFEDLASAAGNGLRRIGKTGWQQFCTAFPDAPNASLAADQIRFDVWWTRRDDGRTAWTLIASQKGKRYPWTMTFIDSGLVIASIGGPTGARFRQNELSAVDLRHLNSLYEKVTQFVKTG